MPRGRSEYLRYIIASASSSLRAPYRDCSSIYTRVSLCVRSSVSYKRNRRRTNSTILLYDLVSKYYYSYSLLSRTLIR
jgi:hypothetical protein